MLGRNEAQQGDKDALLMKPFITPVVTQLFPERDRLETVAPDIAKYRVKAEMYFANGRQQVIALTLHSLTFQLENNAPFKVPEILKETLVPGKSQTTRDVASRMRWAGWR